MSILITIAVCVWYMFMAWGATQLLRTNKVGFDRDIPAFFVFLLWWFLVPGCALCRLKE